MAARRRMRVRRSFAGNRNGRRYFWVRISPSFLTPRTAGTAIHSDILLTQSDWEDPETNLNNTRKGGARLERTIVQYGLSVSALNAFWAPGGSANIALIPEFYMWHQSDQFATVVTGVASFDATLQNQRIIMHDVPEEKTFALISGTNVIRTVQGRYETKSKVRLSEGAIGMAWRGFFNTADGDLLGYTDWVMPTFLVSVP